MKRITLLAVSGLLVGGTQLGAQDSTKVVPARQCRVVYVLVRGFTTADPDLLQGPSGAVLGSLAIQKTRHVGAEGFSNPLTRTLGLVHAEKLGGREPMPISMVRPNRLFPLDGAPVFRCMYPIEERGGLPWRTP